MYQLNPIALKLAPLLAEYLYINKKIDLPGIGTFQLHEQHNPGYEEDKKDDPGNSFNISFQNDPSIKESPDLINFISSKTGKMKPLASADLESHLELVQQFLNIGKPFLFEGIGSLVKIRSGQYEFTSGEVISDKIKDYSAKEITATSSTEDSFTDYNNVLSPKKFKFKIGKPIIALILLAGIAVAIWSGYKMYKKRTSKNNPVATTEKKTDEAVLVTDSSQLIRQTDTTKKAETITTQQPIATGDTYKFVVEEADKERALSRYNSLKSWGLTIQMETADSSFFKLFFLLPASVSDTAKLMDSLRIMYTPAWSKSYVEK